MDVPSLRSMLFVPGNRPEWVAKAVAAGADAVILDLEDAVPVAERAAAREQVREFLSAPPPVPVVVRVNSPLDPAVAQDVAAVVGPGLTAVMVPKIESVADVHVLDRLLGWAETAGGLAPGAVGLMPVLETANGIRHAHDLARASARVVYLGGLGVKGGDVERSLGFRWTPEGTETLMLRSRVLLDARAAGVPNPVTGLWTDIGDLDGLRAFAAQSRGLGYEGMLAIHPSHVAIINEAFTPSDADLDEDTALVAAMEDAAARGRGAVVFRGDMIDEAMASTARRRLARFRPG